MEDVGARIIIEGNAQQVISEFEKLKNSLAGVTSQTKATKDASGDLYGSFKRVVSGDIRGGVEGLVGSLGSLGSVAAGAATVGLAVFAAWNKMSEEGRQLISTIDTMADKYGMSTKEAGAVVNMANIMGVQVGVLNMAFRTMSRQGIEPTLAGLMQVKQRLDATHSPAERTALAVKLLGRSGLELNETLSLTTKELGSLITKAESSSLVTKKMADAQDQYNRALGNYKNIQLQANTVSTNAGRITLDNIKLWYQRKEAELSLAGALRSEGIPENVIYNSTIEEQLAIMQKLQGQEVATGGAISDAGRSLKEWNDIASATPRVSTIGEVKFPTIDELKSQIDGINTALDSAIADWINKFDALRAGLGDVAATFGQLQVAAATGMPADQVDAYAQQLQAVAVALEENEGILAHGEAADKLKAMGMNAADIEKFLRLSNSDLSAMARKVTAEIYVKVTGPGSAYFASEKRASGGDITGPGVYEVGEAGSEGVINGMVIPHAQWMQMRGMFGRVRGFREGTEGFVGSYYTGPSDKKNDSGQRPWLAGWTGATQETSTTQTSVTTQQMTTAISQQITQATQQQTAAIMAAIPSAQDQAIVVSGILSKQTSDLQRTNNELVQAMRLVYQELRRQGTAEDVGQAVGSRILLGSG